MEAAKVVENFKSEYNRKCKYIFAKFPDVVDAKTLTKLHEAICVEARKLLEMDICPAGTHGQLLEKYA